MPNGNPQPNGSPANQANDLRSKYNLAPLPKGVLKISGLVKGRASASMDEISEIINTDSGVTQRLLTLAYPKQAARLGATVQMATSRLGVNRVIVVMVGDLLTKAVIETFSTMVAMDLDVADATAMAPTDYGYLTGTVRFTGQNSGQVTLALSPILSLTIAAQLLGSSIDDEISPEAVNDAFGELVNIVTGSLQSKLSDAGLPSEVGLPEVAFQRTMPTATVPGGSLDTFYFKSGIHAFAALLSIDPSSSPNPAASPRAPSTHGTVWRANGP